MSTNTSNSSLAGSVYAARLELFPCEHPTYKQASQWLEKAEDDLTQGPYGPALRGQVPPQLCHLTIKRDDGIIDLPDEARAKASPKGNQRTSGHITKASQEITKASQMGTKAERRTSNQ